MPARRRPYELILGDGAKLFDLSQEKPELRERYGRNTFGQSCLMARRLVEQGVPYVTINYGGWDTHKQHFETMRRKLPGDGPRLLRAARTPSSNRGLLDTTIVVVERRVQGGRRACSGKPLEWWTGHHGACFCAVVAGGRVQRRARCWRLRTRKA